MLLLQFAMTNSFPLLPNMNDFSDPTFFLQPNMTMQLQL